MRSTNDERFPPNQRDQDLSEVEAQVEARTRYERDPGIHEAFLTLACSILCWRRLNSL